MNTPKIHCADSINATIPKHLLDLRIDVDWLKSKSACSEGLSAFSARFPNGALYPEVRIWITEINRPDWENWMLRHVGGDVATAGDRGTATAGDRGTATAGEGGTATAGYNGTATAGYNGTATAGEGGVITIEYYDTQSSRYKRMIGYVGEGGLKPNTAYHLNKQAQFEEVKP